MNNKLLVLIGVIENEIIESIAKDNITKSSRIYINPERKISIKEQLTYADGIALGLSEGHEIILITESDYILKELNTYIMFSYLSEDIKKDLLLKYNIKEEFIIDPNKVKGYEFYNDELIEMEIVKEGIISKYLDYTINYINGKLDDIFYSIEDI